MFATKRNSNRLKNLGKSSKISNAFTRSSNRMSISSSRFSRKRLLKFVVRKLSAKKRHRQYIFRELPTAHVREYSTSRSPTFRNIIITQTKICFCTKRFRDITFSSHYNRKTRNCLISGNSHGLVQKAKVGLCIRKAS